MMVPLNGLNHQGFYQKPGLEIPERVTPLLFRPDSRPFPAQPTQGSP